MRFEQGLEQHEFEIQVLLSWRVINDGDGTKRLVATCQPPLLHEHVEYRLCARFGGRFDAKEVRDLRAAGLLHALHFDVEQRATGIGIDFDELRSIRRDVKIETEEYAASSRWNLRDNGRGGEHLFAKAGQAGHRLHCADDTSHLLRVLLRDEYRDIGKKMRMRFDNGSLDARSAKPGIESLLQGGQVGSHAFAFTIETLGEADCIGHAATFRCARTRNSIVPATAPTSCAAMNAGTSSGRMPVKLFVSERPIVIAGFANDVEAVNQ